MTSPTHDLEQDLVVFSQDCVLWTNTSRCGMEGRGDVNDLATQASTRAKKITVIGRRFDAMILMRSKKVSTRVGLVRQGCDSNQGCGPCDHDKGGTYWRTFRGPISEAPDSHSTRYRSGHELLLGCMLCARRRRVSTGSCCCQWRGSRKLVVMIRSSS